MNVPVRVAGELVIRVDDLPPMALPQIKSALTFANEDREKAAQEKIFGWWDMPEVITLYREEERRGGDHVICLPRGFASQLAAGMRSMGHGLVWDDQRVKVPSAPGYFRPFVLRDYQLDAVIKMLKAQQGFYECPAGGGKTVTILGLMGWAQQRSLVIVDKAGLLEQWRERAATFHGLSLNLSDERSVGKIGEDVWEERDLTICLRQTLWSRLWEMDATKWWLKWGLTEFDEGHHLSGETLGEICRRSVSFYLGATSATPAKSPTRGQVVHALVGPIVAQTTRKELYERGVLIQPEVHQISTGFEAEFWPTHDVTTEQAENGECVVPGCRKRKNHSHRNNYATVLKKLVEDPRRNALIASEIVRDRGHIHLVASRQLKHLDLLHEAVVAAGWDGPIYMLRGEENAEGMAMGIAKAIEAGGVWEFVKPRKKRGQDPEPPYWRQVSELDGEREAVVFSTVADEGLDIPPIDRTHVVFPMRQEAAVIQLIGRGERISQGKVDSLVLDYVDEGCEVFKGQAGERDWCYRKQGYNVRPRETVNV